MVKDLAVYEKRKRIAGFRGSPSGPRRKRDGGFNSIYAAAPGVTREE